jgi:oligogalacturonide transport system substrate-binding protein
LKQGGKIMNKFLRSIAMTCALMVPLTMLSGCGSSSADASKEKTNSGSQNVTLRFAWWGSESRHKATLAAIDAYTKKNPNVKIQPEYMGYDGYEKKLLTQFAGNAAPDIFQGVPAWFMDVSDENYLDLNKYSNVLDSKTFNKSLISEATYKDHLEAVPAGVISTAFMFNKEFFKKFGIPEDTDWTWEKLIEVGKKVHEQDKNAYLVTGDLDVINRLYATAYLSQKSGDVWIKDDYTIAVDKPLLTQTMQYMSDLFTSGTMEPLGNSSAFLGKMEQNPKWIKGEIGGVIALTSNLPAMMSAIPNGQFGIAKVPQDKDAKESANPVRASVQYSINAKTKNVDEAVKFVNWLVNDKDAALILGEERGTPASETARKALSDGGKLNPLISKALDLGMKDPGTIPNGLCENAEIWQINKDVITEIGYGKTTPDKGADEILKGYQQKLSELKASK